MNYDSIGDIHGRQDKLDALLRRLGYREHRGAWRHPDRSAVFVGDLIDRGAHQAATVDRVRRMVYAGAALCVMGHHEFNAIAWITPDPQDPREHMRPHGKPGNLAQHRAFLAEVEGKPLHRELIDWFRTPPLWLDPGACGWCTPAGTSRIWCRSPRSLVPNASCRKALYRTCLASRPPW